MVGCGALDGGVGDEEDLRRPEAAISSFRTVMGFSSEPDSVGIWLQCEVCEAVEVAIVVEHRMYVST
jgi:hypothetical protein